MPSGKKPTSKAIGSAKKNGRREGVLIGIIDTGGSILRTRIYITTKDRRGSSPSGTSVETSAYSAEGLSRGSEFLQRDLNAAIEAANKLGLPPTAWIERQSHLQLGCQVAHMASIAAGKLGTCSKAKIAAVLVRWF